jgi:Ca-activated chloride channel homolog
VITSGEVPRATPRQSHPWPPSAPSVSVQTMNRGQILLAAIAVLAVGAVALLAGGGGGGDDDDSGGGSGGTRPSGDALRISFVYSPEKEPLIKPLVEEFNREKRESGGRPVFVDARILASGDAETQIARERLQPVAWSPASSLWGRLVNFEADRPFAPDESPSIVRTPLVIAMWEQMARALDYPRKKIGFADIVRLGRSQEGWGAYGKPEFGRFKLVHTNPQYSTSGLSAVVAEYYSATGKKEGLTVADIGSRARRIVRDIERSIVHYGDTTLFISEQMRKSGPGYASAVAMEEATLLEFNRTARSGQKLVAIYPSEGTFYSDNPFIVLEAPWVSREEAEAARTFQRFLAEKITPELAARSGFRPADLDTEPVAPITKENGVDPAQPERVLGLPEPRVLARIKSAWREDRKPANILLVLDTSGSMQDEDRLERAKQGLEIFFRETAPQDRVGLTVFSDEIRPVLPIRPFREARNELRSSVRDLIADGGTAYYDAAARAFEEVRNLNDEERINAVVLLTDGEDTDSSLPFEELIGRLEGQGDTENRVRIFTIAYSAQAAGAREQLKKIAEATGGQAYEGSTEDIETVYRSISSFF